eukprot:SAG11_NODE_391_length_9839_cov_4.875257_8_plen_59_part_00
MSFCTFNSLVDFMRFSDFLYISRGSVLNICEVFESYVVVTAIMQYVDPTSSVYLKEVI